MISGPLIAERNASTAAGTRCVLEEENDQVPRIAHGFLREGIALDRRVPFARCPHDERRTDVQTLFGPVSNSRFESRARRSAAREDEVAGLEQRAHVIEPVRFEERSEVRHAHKVAAANVDGAKRRNLRRHTAGPRVVAADCRPSSVQGGAPSMYSRTMPRQVRARAGCRAARPARS